MSIFFKVIGKFIRQHKDDIFYILGLVILSVGVWFLNPPSSLIVFGAGIILYAIFFTRG